MVRDGSGRELALSENPHFPFSPEDIFKMACAEYKRAIENLPDPNEIIEGEIFRAKYEFASCYNKFWFGKWYEQPHKVIVLCEKEADYPVISSILEDKEISIGFTRGYSGKLLMYEVAKQFRYHKGIPVVLLLGDFDPSGQDIKANVGRDLERFGIKSILLPF